MIEEVTHENIDDVLPLIRKYQGFYGGAYINDEKNKTFFSQFIKSDNGVLHLYRCEGKAIGFSTIYNGFSSTRAETVAILNDLYVSPSYRGKGYGKELVDHAIKVAKSKGYSRLQWLTAQDNDKAQKLYKALGAIKGSWFFYTKET
jgi:ribosomal protein S18 acetylase RimI-like enzyme